jgi:hypothetical protein
MPDWRWNEALRRYQDLDTGRILSFDAVKVQVNRIVDATTENVTSTLADMLADKRLSVNDWHQAMGRAVKNAYVQQAELGAGGRTQMTPVEWGTVGGAVREQYGYLRDFAQEIADGQLTDAQIRSRSAMYVNSSREAFWRIRDRKEREKGMTQERWAAVGDAGTCGPCFDGDAMDWQPLGTFAQPGSGRVLVRPETSCEGLTNCRCEKEYQ